MIFKKKNVRRLRLTSFNNYPVAQSIIYVIYYNIIWIVDIEPIAKRLLTPKSKL